MPVGNRAVGKTTLSRVLDLVSKGKTIEQEKLNGIRPTQNMEFEYITTSQTFGSTQFNVTLQFLIPPGQKETDGDSGGLSFEKVIEIFRSSIRRLDVVLFTYDLENLGSFNDLSHWVHSVAKLMNDATHMILLGTHLDQGDETGISEDEIKEKLEFLRNEILVDRPTWQGNCADLEVSCVSGENLGLLLTILAASIIKSRQIMP